MIQQSYFFLLPQKVEGINQQTNLHTHVESSFIQNCQNLETTKMSFVLPGDSDGIESACNAGNLVQSLGQEDPLKKVMATLSSILAWRIPTDRGAWRITVMGLQSRTRLSEKHTHPRYPSECVCVCVSRSSPVQLCSLMDCSLLGSSIHGILQARTWSGLPCPSPGDLSNQGIESVSLTSPALVGTFLTTSATWETLILWATATESVL